MKKIVVILLLLTYGSAIIGATVNLHYCMNEFVGWTLIHDKDEKCGKCGMEEIDKEGCCKNEQQHFKLNVDHQKSNVSESVTFITTPVSFAPVIDLDFHSYLNITERFPACHAPPDIGKNKLHILHGVFLV